MGRRSGTLGVLALLWAAVASATAHAESDPPTEPPQPRYSVRRDAPWLAFGGVSLVVGLTSNPDMQPVPLAGLDRSQIHFEFDARSVGHDDTGANSASNWLRNAAIAFPIVLSAASAPDGTRWRAPLQRALLYAESMGVAQGITAVTKNAASRPRPFAYLPAAARPSNSRYDVADNRAFQSMPSGHATTAWCAVGFAITDHLLTRAGASWKEHAAVSFVGGALATTTSMLRVDAGQHFPSDVIAGGAIGAVSGVAIPLLHRYAAGGAVAPGAPRRSWFAAAAGVTAGIGAGLLVGVATGSR
jgi:membrane-associated phospholipid phosphatase